jgi:NAD(P)H dehydrogenase (quinone)
MNHNDSHTTVTLAVAYHSGFGHTATLAGAVAAGATAGGATVKLLAVDSMTDADWEVLDTADGIIFGSATYMGNVSAGFQAFAEKTGRRCLEGAWRDKVAAGFTNSGAKSGDKFQSLVSLAVFAAQHHMHWVNLGLGAGWNSAAGSEHDLNRLGFWLGAGAQTDVDANPDQVHPADVRTCEHLGRRVALVTRQMVSGRVAAQHDPAGLDNPAAPANPAVSALAASSAPAR